MRLYYRREIEEEEERRIETNREREVNDFPFQFQFPAGARYTLYIKPTDLIWCLYYLKIVEARLCTRENNCVIDEYLD
jgi:hypothetical protein